ncbi:hypothetical protein FRC09_016602 [Ceratobasidium sp. 395]|nr:hypothetical protein FRC09_016602 [Ceratobasidium sp. 395]
MEVNNTDIHSDSSYRDDERDSDNEESSSENKECDPEEDECDGNTNTYNNHKTLLEKIDEYVELYAAEVKKNKEQGELERNAAMPKDFDQKFARAIVVKMFIDGKSCRVLLDSGSLGDLISTTTVNQLRIKTGVLAKPMGLAMAVSGSRGVIKHSATVNIKYQDIDKQYCLDVVNLDRYHLILGTTFRYKHSIMLGFNPKSVLVQSNKALPLDGPTI